jgi:hypothetical protein
MDLTRNYFWLSRRAECGVKYSPHALDKYHQQFKKDTWAVGKYARLLVDLIDNKSSE